MQRRSLQPYLLILVFAAPLLLAALAYFGPWEWARPGGAAHGELLSPPVALPPMSLDTSSAAGSLGRRWSLIYASAAPCREPCIARLNRLNQVRLALGSDRRRAQVVLFFVGSAPALPAGAEVTLARLDGAGAQRLRALFEERGLDRVYLADPLGRLVMRYPADLDQRGLLEDLERLMTVEAAGD